MTNTLTFEYNTMDVFASQLVELIRASKAVKVIDSPYDPQAVRRIQRAAKEPMTHIDRTKLWD
ncbi:MAG: hypothetical protein KBS69_06040 [Bacteroidales bacterium]|nr:hypothetical protein [Candidatus Colicola caccequi]